MLFSFNGQEERDDLRTYIMSSAVRTHSLHVRHYPCVSVFKKGFDKVYIPAECLLILCPSGGDVADSRLFTSCCHVTDQAISFIPPLRLLTYS